MEKKVITVVILMAAAMTLLFAQSKLVMGVYLHDMSRKDYDELGIKENYGVKIDVLVKDGPADLAGMKPDDVILTIDGEKVRSSDQISKMFYSRKKGQKITVEFLRDGVIKNVPILLAEKEIYEKPYLGVYLSDLSQKEYKEFNVKDMRGVLIQKVANESPAAAAGLLADDVLITFDKEKIYSENQLHKLLKEYKIGEKVKLEVVREGKIEKLTITLGDRDDEKSEIRIKS